MLPTWEMLGTKIDDSLFLRIVPLLQSLPESKCCLNHCAIVERYGIFLKFGQKAKLETFGPTEILRVQECERTDLPNIKNLQFEVGRRGKYFFNFFKHCSLLGTFQSKFKKEKFYAKCFITIVKSHIGR